MQLNKYSSVAVIEELRAENMDTEEWEYLQTLSMSPAEKIMMEFDSSSKDLRGVFKILKENNLIGSIHQQHNLSKTK